MKFCWEVTWFSCQDRSEYLCFSFHHFFFRSMFFRFEISFKYLKLKYSSKIKSGFDSSRTQAHLLYRNQTAQHQSDINQFMKMYEKNMNLFEIQSKNVHASFK
ncbi:Hypothetical_protein [Hexamita inflata]|uniref:Hypothetical_protein n=1 Tax=Hexamita inflata TaxID=28002 RepID=A0AA86PAF7_9EUKA|nr:Hypothetical protein HINF_LOCUS22610 [Hexamita inflata]